MTTKKSKPAAVECWHFLPDDRRLRHGERTLVKRGSVMRFDGEPILCQQGLHGSIRAINALYYAPGPIICRVEIGGTVVHGDDKLCGTERRCLWMADATNTLHEFAWRCAEDALRTAKVEDVRCWAAIETKRKWLRGEATDEELNAAWSAALSASRAAARSAAAWSARSAAEWSARSAAESAARSAAESAARSAAAWSARSAAAWSARSAEESAARSAQNTRLEEMLFALQPKPRKTKPLARKHK